MTTSDGNNERNWLQEKIFGVLVLIIASLIAFSVNSILHEIRSVKLELKEVVTIMQGEIRDIRSLQESRRDRVVNILSEVKTQIGLNSERIRSLEKTGSQ